MKHLLNLLLVSFLFLGEGHLLAQNEGLQVGVNLTGGFPVGRFNQENLAGLNADFGLGGTATLDYFFNENLHLGLEGGMIRYDQVLYLSEIASNWTPSLASTIEGRLEDGYYSMVPLQLSVAYHTGAWNYLDLYAGTGVGVFLVERYFVEDYMQEAFGQSASLIGFSPRVGLSYELSSSIRMKADLGFYYILGNEEESFEEDNITIDDKDFAYATSYQGLPDITSFFLNIGFKFVIFQ